MSNPIIADNKPKKVTLEAGKKYSFCTCGRSNNQPFCDGAHAGTGFSPKRFVAAEDGHAFLCQCKYTDDVPYCDGTHSKFGIDQVGTG
jgi:CDGSH-type Zn-finger protein